MSNILVTAIGSFSAEIVINNLHKKDHRIIGMDIYNKEWVANSLLVDVFYQSPYATDEEKYIDAMLEICKKENVEYIMPLTDVEVDVINANRASFEDVIICLPKEDTINVCRNKYDLYNYLLQNGLDCLILTQKVVEEMSQWNLFPAVIKPMGGRSSEGLYRVKNRKELLAHMQNEDLENYIIQPQIDGTVLTVDVLRADEFLMATSRLELLRTKNGAGTTVRVFKDEKLIHIVEKIAEALDIKGCVNFEFIKTEDGEYKFLECNPRFSAGVAFSCMAGYDYVTNHFNCHGKRTVDEKSEVKEMIIARKYAEYIMKY